MGALDSIRDDVARDEIKKLKRQMLRMSDKVNRADPSLLVDYGDSLPAKPNNPNAPMLFIKTTKPAEFWLWAPQTDGTWDWNGPLHVMI